MATKYFANKPIKHGKTHYRPGDEITGFTGWWRYWQYLRYNRVNRVDTGGAVTLGAATPGNQTLTLVATIPSDLGDPYTVLQYQLDSGAWVDAFDFTTAPGSDSVTIMIEGLTNGQTYSVKARVLNDAGVGTTSNTVTGTPRTTPAAPTALVATPGDGQLSIAFTPGADGGSAITNYQYRVGTTGSYTAFSPADTTSPVVVTGLANDVEVTVYLRAVNAAGNGASASVTGTPTGV